MKRTSIVTVMCILISWLLNVVRQFVVSGNLALNFLLGLLSILLTSIVLLLWVRVLVWKGMKRAKNIHWGRPWQLVWRKMPKLPARKEKVDGVPVQELADFCIQVRVIKLALFGMTPEQEEARCQYYQRRNMPLPELILPQRNTALYADYVRLTAVMDIIGFPAITRLSIQSERLAFLKTWADELQGKISHVQLPAIVATSQNRLIKECKELFATYPSAATTPEYFRLAGAVAFLERIAQDGRVPVEVLDYCTQRLQRDLSTLRQRLHQMSARMLANHS